MEKLGSVGREVEVIEARRQLMADTIKMRAKDSYKCPHSTFDLNFGEVVEISDLYETGITDYDRTKLLQYRNSTIAIRCHNAFRLDPIQLEERAKSYVGRALGSIIASERPSYTVNTILGGNNNGKEN